MRPFHALLGGYGGLRLLELALSRRNERRLERRGVRRRSERGFGWLVAAHATPFLLGPVEAAFRPPAPRPLAGAATAALVASGLLRAWTIATLRGSWSVRVRAGRRMRIVDRGPYRFVRHPNYLAALVELAALPLAGGAFATAAAATLLDAIGLARRISDEERALSASRAWRRRVAPKPRLLPRLRGRGGRAAG